MTGALASWCRGRLWRGLMERARPMSEEELACSAVIIAPHPDDEVLACGGTILAKRARGARVAIVQMSDGSASHSRFMGSELLQERREAEAREAASRLGLRDEDLFFLGIKDGHLQEEGEHSLSRLQGILEDFRPAQVFIPYRAEGVTDHEASRTLAIRALQDGGLYPEVYEYAVWFWHHWPWTRGRARDRFPRWLRRVRHGFVSMSRLRQDFDCRVDIKEFLEEKRWALEAHSSQMVREESHPEWPILSDVADGEWLKLFFRSAEMYHRYDPRASSGP